MKWLKINTVLLSTVLSFWVSLSQADTQFRVIVDASGSMLISDPDRLTSEALRLISNLVPEEEATLGIWLFGEVPRVLLPEAPVNKETKAKLADDRLHSSGMYASDDSDGENDAEGKQPQVTPVKEPSPARGKTTRLRRRQYSEGTPKQVSPMASPGLAPTPPVRKGKSSETTPKRPTPGTKTPSSKKIAAVTPKSDKEDSDLEISWSEQMAQKEAEVANNSAGSQTPKLPQI